MKNIKYIIKRIIIGVGIALVLGFLRGNILLGVQAKEISSYSWGAQYFNVTTGSSSVDFSINTQPWANWRYGYLYFGFSINKDGGSATDPILLPRYVVAYSDTTGYVCNIGTNTNSNSTWTGSSYSVTCPMDLGPPGLTRILINFQPISQQSTSTYQVIIGGIGTYETADSTNITLNQTDTTNAINNQITNDNTNTNNIINNQNQNTQQQIESQQVCTVYDKNAVILDNSYVASNGTITSNNAYGVTDFISITSSTIEVLSSAYGGTYANICFYNVNKSFISCTFTNSVTEGDLLTIPNNASFVRASIRYELNKPTFKVCKNGNQALADQQQQINNTLNDDNVSGASSEASSFFDNFNVDSHGISGVITAPLRLLNSLTTASCTPLSFQLPFVHDQVTLPCMKGIYQTHFGIFFSLWQLITTGLISYNVCLNFYKKIHDLEDPNNDRIEVLNL